MSTHQRELETPRHSPVAAAVIAQPRPSDTRWARWLQQSTKVTSDGHGATPGLDALIEVVRAASRPDRIRSRDRLAAFGADAIEAVRPWLADPEFGAFAVRVIQAAAIGDARDEGIAALRRGKRTAANVAIKQDIDFALDQLDARRRTPRPAAV